MFKNIQYYQRVILLVWLGVSAGELRAATDCNQVTEIPVSECQSLLELYNSTNGANWKNKTGWNQTNTPCSWFGVGCDGGHVQKIDLWNNNLVGALPNLNLPNLQRLSLGRNQLSGSIPNFSNLPNLGVLYLYQNQLSGNIPNFVNLPKLQHLSLDSNQLDGSIPNFTNLPQLYSINFSSNHLIGNIPNFTNLPNLQNLFLNNNQQSGNIPNFTNLPNLQNLLLSYNQLSESIPNFTNLPHLYSIDFSLNYLVGDIPNFSNLPNLASLVLYSNKLSGSIPNFTNLPNLARLYLHNNQLSGDIPNFTNLPHLTSLELSSNYLVGNIPYPFPAIFIDEITSNEYVSHYNNNCGLTVSNVQLETILNKKDPDWKTKNPNCPVPHILTLNKSGNGQISGGGTFAANSTVNLSATPDADSKFVGWSPSPCATSFQMPTNDLTCTANFVLKRNNLTITKSEHGTILAEGINCGADCNETYVENTVVTLNAMPETGYKLESWSGDCVGNLNSCQITMNGNKTVNASFSLIPSYPLTLQTSGDGLGSISGNGNYRVGETVNLTASPDANSVFVDWKPAPCNSSFEMPNNPLTCIATFNKKGSTSSTTDLTFFQINPLYNIGEWLHARLKTQLNVASRFNRVDLWVAIQFPDKTMFFMTAIPTNPLSLEPQTFKRSLERMDAEIVVLDFEVPPNMGGDYTFYALYVETGKNPITDGFTIQRSNLAIATTTLRNH